MRKIFFIILVFVILAALALGIKFSFRPKAKAGSFPLSQEEHPALKYPEVAGKRLVQRIELLEPKKAFNFQLLSMHETRVSLEDFKGRLVLLGFIYTNCPDVCGLIALDFRRLQEEFAQEVDNQSLQLVLITTDPARDTPQRISRYTKGYGGRWLFLTGSEPELKEVWENYRVVVKPKEEVGLVYHTYMVVLVDRQGLLRYRYFGLVDPKEIIAQDIKKLLRE